jgi:hypothetical protein
MSYLIEYAGNGMRLNTRQVTFSTSLSCFEYLKQAPTIHLFALDVARHSGITGGGKASLCNHGNLEDEREKTFRIAFRP